MYLYSYSPLPQLLPYPPPLHYQPTSRPPLFKKIIQSSLCCSDILGCGAVPWSVADLPAVTPLKKTGPLSSYQIPIAPAKGGTSYPPPK